MTPRNLALTLLVCGLSYTLAAQPPMQIPYLSHGIQFDGVLDEPCWDTLRPLPLNTFGITFGKKPAQTSEVYLAYDDEYLYLGSRLHVLDPANIRGTTYKRDALVLLPTI